MIELDIRRYCYAYVLEHLYTGWPKKVNHYHESSLNRIKTRH